MTFVSYSQNFEDVMLWRALKHVEGGFYVDIGANDPVVDSVSLAFYERGWRGVHVEPTQQYADKLRAARPDEAVIQMAIGNAPSEVSFYEFADTGLSTADSVIAQSHIDAGFAHLQARVPVISLDALFENIGERDIHWLKIDVEGYEKQVLDSWEKSTTRPWILVIESTKPLTQELAHSEWDELLISKGYRYVYFDGLNRFYISSAHLELEKAFSCPPNIFDGFALSGSASQPFYKLVEKQTEIKVQETVQSTLQHLSDHIANQDRAIALLTEHSDASRKQISEYDNAVSRLRSYAADLEEALKKVQDYAENLDRARLEALERIELLETELSQLRPAE